MTTRELRKELIKFEDEEHCSNDCKKLKLTGFNMDGLANYLCLINNEKLLIRIHHSRDKICRCRSCKDLFKDS